MWDLIVSIPDHCVSFYFADLFNFTPVGWASDSGIKFSVKLAGAR